MDPTPAPALPQVRITKTGRIVRRDSHARGCRSKLAASTLARMRFIVATGEGFDSGVLAWFVKNVPIRYLGALSGLLESKS